MTTYFLSSKSGNDLNSGASSNQAWSSFSKLSGKLKAGDTVLLERGSDFDQTLTFSKISGTVDLPITVSAYGTGNAPILSSDTGKGIHSQYSNNIILENLTIQGTGNAGIYATASSNWVIRNVTFDNAGGSGNIGSINWWNSSNIVIENNTVLNSRGDGIFMSNVNKVVVKDSEFLNVTGSSADNIQISGNDVILEGNILVIHETSNTTKGNLVFQGQNIYAHDNYLQGGSFGMSLSADNVLVANNVLKGHDKYSWSSNLMLTDQVTGDVADNIAIRDNNFYDANRNITIDGKNTTAANMTVNKLIISGNEFNDWVKAPVVINGANANGVYEKNISNKDGNLMYATNSDLSHLISYDNIYIPENLTATAFAAPITKTVAITASGSFMEGIAPMMKLYLNGVEVGAQSVTALKVSGQKETLTFQIASFFEGDKLSIKFTNDKNNAKTGEDRNLYVHSVSMDGQALNLKSADLSAKVVNQKNGNGWFFSSNATATFTSDDVPQHVLSKVVVAQQALPKLEDILESDHPNIIYNGQGHDVGVTSDPGAYGASFKQAIGEIDTLHQLLANNFGSF